jgi:hypothetical protein
MGLGLALKKDVAGPGRISTETGKSEVEKTGSCPYGTKTRRIYTI